ncbi:hypothetical protein D3P07_07265 [Paenibacillus sp. 1011MAR3C5]|uniref:hypothetical protein n=1 Tax=Paenibacillus sp. 1011MAR3C5 TaxID=1675787 RepID=UPI000E6D526F|nr:hypothetical protein [Paenibacillus sp. 1011MAR3C5]RJE90008.1 hypothetical protein D3P07_07265 [Paenibacillus sp. 1011MAR3C5]
MEKRLTTTAMLFSLGFVFMLVFAVGAFFYGIQIGTEKAEAKYTAKSEAGKKSEDTAPYQQQELVSFYLTVFSPYREFQAEWLTVSDKLLRGGNLDAGSAFKNLAKLADQKAEEASSFNMQKSPLLGEAQVAYIRSLKYFKDTAAKAAADKTNDPAKLLEHIKSDKNYKSAVGESLAAQQAYYDAMQKWAASVDPAIPAAYKAATPMSVDQWDKLSLIVKNRVAVSHLSERGELFGFMPQDLTSRVDEFIRSGQASKMKLNTVGGIVDILLNTRAVDAGDFSANKARFYQSETLPQLPFFYSE